MERHTLEVELTVLILRIFTWHVREEAIIYFMGGGW